MNMHVTPYEFGNINNLPETRVKETAEQKGNRKVGR